MAAPTEAVLTYRSLESGRAPRRFRRIVELRLSGGRALADSRYDEAFAAIEADIALRFRNRLSLVRMGRLWTKNVLSNVAAMKWEEVSPLFIGGKPIVVCGAGPSLETAIPLMHHYRDSITVIACDTASGALAAAGIMPDAVVCLEGQIYNIADFLPLDGRPTRLVVDLSAHPSSYRAVSGPKTLTLSEWTESAFLRRLASAGLPVAVVPPLGSVGVLALKIATLLGGTVLVSGLDFSFSPGKTHCSGSPSDLKERRLETRTYKKGASWNASFKDGTRLARGGLLTDPALSMYASLASSELGSFEAYDLRGGYGAPLPLRLLTDGEASELLEAASARSELDVVTSRTFGASNDVGADEYRARARAFLEGELRLANRVSDALRTGMGAVELRSLLTEADFLYAHFPDPERVLALAPDALKRVAAEAAYWRGRLEPYGERP